MNTPTFANPHGRLPAVPRHVAIAAGVVLLHLLVLWALQSGLLRKTVEVLVPVQLLAEFVAPPAPIPAPDRHDITVSAGGGAVGAGPAAGALAAASCSRRITS